MIRDVQDPIQSAQPLKIPFGRQILEILNQSLIQILTRQAP